jgi:endonuclease/exonuclease/phosphatase family metal-dependent hydrolase
MSSVVTAMTWNIHGSAKPSLRGLADWIEGCGVSLLLLQEVQQRQAARLADMLGWTSQRWSLKHAPVVKPPEGMAIMSTYPITAMTTSVLSSRVLPTNYRRRIAQRATVQLPKGDVSVCNVHLASGDTGERPAQVARLHSILDGVSVLGGDFNDKPFSETLERITRLGFQRSESEPTAWAIRDGSGPPSLVIDHLLVRSGAGIQRARTFSADEVREIRKLSDHLPVVAQLSW